MALDPTLQAFLEAQRADYRASLPQRLAQLQSAWSDARQGADPAAALARLERCAHSLAGSSATFGLAPLGDAARALEALLAPEGGAPAPAQLLADPRVHASYEQVCAQLQAAIGGPPAG